MSEVVRCCWDAVNHVLAKLLCLSVNAIWLCQNFKRVALQNLERLIGLAHCSLLISLPSRSDQHCIWHHTNGGFHPFLSQTIFYMKIWDHFHAIVCYVKLECRWGEETNSLASVYVIWRCRMLEHRTLLFTTICPHVRLSSWPAILQKVLNPIRCSVIIYKEAFFFQHLLARWTEKRV